MGLCWPPTRCIEHSTAHACKREGKKLSPPLLGRGNKSPPLLDDIIKCLLQYWRFLAGLNKERKEGKGEKRGRKARRKEILLSRFSLPQGGIIGALLSLFPLLPELLPVDYDFPRKKGGLCEKKRRGKL